MKVKIDSEYGRLRKVLMCSASCYKGEDSDHDPISASHKGRDKPKVVDLIIEQAEYFKLIQESGAEIILADVIEKAFDQVFTRDVAFAIGDKFFLSSMKERLRERELKGVKSILKSFNIKIFRVPKSIILEGGDVLVHGREIFMGLGLRTTIEAKKYLQKALGRRYTIHPMQLKENLLHLDVVFTILPRGLALVYEDGLEQASLEILREKFEIISLTKEEQETLGANVFCLNENTVVVQKQHERIAEELTKRGLTVKTVDLAETSKRGGALRCTTCPLERD